MTTTNYINISRFLSGSSSGTGVLSGEYYLADPLSLFFVQAIIIISICRFLSIIGIYLKQPRVIFEIIGGILIGPSCLSRIPSFQNTLFSPTSPTAIPNLQLVASIGLVLYLFIIGMELDPKLLIKNGKRAASVAIIGMIVPFALGVAISRTLFDTLQGDDPIYGSASFTAFYVFIGTAMSITAFPVLARILKEGGLIYTKVGALTMGAAAINDAIAWCLLILAISIANAGSMIIAFYVFLSVLALATFLFLVFAPFFKWLVLRIESWNSTLWNSNLFALTLCLLFLLSWTTTLLGVHSIFGAFLFGLTVPRESHLFRECNEKIEELVLTLFLPLYFAASGLKTDITQINTGAQGAMIVLVCVIATSGKLIGAGVPAYVSGLSFRESSVIAFLMNTRGLVELIVLNLGIQSGILNTKTFSVMVIMCLFTTFLTCPVVETIYPKRMRVRVADEVTDEKTAINALISRDDEALLPGSVAISINPSSCVSLDRLQDTISLCVVVDELYRLQELMNVVTCFAPQSKAASLSLLAVKFVEPTNSHADEFIGFEDNGRVIRVDPEPTMYDANNWQNLPGSVKPQLLPLSMLCRSIGSSVSAYQVIGNPDEFPSELRSMSDNAGSDFVLLPWRKNSVYFQSLFWGMLRTTHVPVMLLVHQESAQEEEVNPLNALTNRSRMSSTSMITDMVRNLTSVSPEKAGQSTDDGDGEEEKTSGDLEGGSAIEMSDAATFHSPEATTTTPFKSATATANKPEVGSVNVLPNHRMSVSNAPEATGILKTLAAIITGKDTDTYILSLMLRFSQNPRFEVSIFVCKNYKLYSQVSIYLL